ncbi:hypothetical protein [Phenylobacterium sp.]|uniref:hypothetical protein n=1 Tax=Phenylobacterium sp. TaxID=1871053 RepID=UPI002736FE72|nr:hypothetical protein [Phenylobacterium sp.]MDP3853219.1 hypothetical protein [Phenylobacterium sp.]
MRLILVHSPLVGPASWGEVPAELAARGYAAQVATLPGWLGVARPYYPALAAALAQAVEPGDLLVLHSGAGGLAASVAALAESRLAGMVFVDAILPHPGRSWFDTAAAPLGEALRAAASDGLLPSWDQWFPPGAIAALAPEGRIREAFLAELRPAPLGYFDEPAPALEMPLGVGWSYLRLSKAYEAEAAQARALGRPTLRLELSHLAMMSHPAEVASSLVRLVRRAP